MDRLDAMAVLLAVVEEGSLSAGARRLRLPLTTVSRKVSELEAHVGARLLVCTSRRVELTAAGAGYVEAAQRILGEVRRAEQAAAGEHGALRGELIVTAPVVFGRRHLLPVVSGFLQAHAEIALRLMLSDRNANIVDDHVDVALRIGQLADSALVATRIGTVRRVVCAAPDYLARRGTPEHPRDLADHDTVAVEGFALAPTWRFAPRGAPPLAVPIRPRLAVNTIEAAVDAACDGLGIARVLSYQVADEVRAGTLRLVLEAFEPEPLPIGLLHDERGRASPKVGAFLDWTVPRLKARLRML